MDPYANQQTGHELPPARPAGNMVPLNRAPEMQPIPAAPEMAHQAAAPAMPAAPPPLTMPPGTMQITQAPVNQPATDSSTPAVANDLDLIEKEWVDKAKAIVASTRTDPHAQNDQMNHFKADYMKKRYGKDIKIET